MIACGITLIGATTYLVVTRIVNRRNKSKRSRRGGKRQSPYAEDNEASDDDVYGDELVFRGQEDEEDFDYRVAYERKTRRRGSGFYG